MLRGMELERLTRTWALTLVVVLHVLAILSAALVFWMTRPGPQREAPRLAFEW
jgi:hypothetical protein